MRWLVFLIPLVSVAAVVPADISGVRPGPVTVSASAEIFDRSLAGRSIPHVDSRILIGLRQAADHEDWRGSTPIVRNAWPQYWATTGKRRGRAGFDEFFDFPGNHPEGTRRFEGAFRPVSVKARSIGNRIEVLFKG